MLSSVQGQAFGTGEVSAPSYTGFGSVKDWEKVSGKPWWYSQSLHKWYVPQTRVGSEEGSGGSNGGEGGSGDAADKPVWGTYSQSAGRPDWYQSAVIPGDRNVFDSGNQYPLNDAPTGFGGTGNTLTGMGVFSSGGFGSGKGYYFDKEPVMREYYLPPSKDEGLLDQFFNPEFMHFASAVGASFGLAGLAGQFAGGLSSLAPGALEEMTALGGFPGATPIAPTSSFSFGDILANQFSPQNIATSLAKTGITSAITGQKLTPEGIAAGLVGGAVGSAASSAVGGGAVGSIASTAASTGTQAALGGMINNGGQIGNTAPSSPPISAQTVNAATPGSNAVPGSFSLALSSFDPQFHRNTAGVTNA